MIGLSDDMRSNFQVMKELAVHTRMTPEPRANQLCGFIDEVKQYVIFCMPFEAILLLFLLLAGNVDGFAYLLKPTSSHNGIAYHN